MANVTISKDGKYTAIYLDAPATQEEEDYLVSAGCRISKFKKDKSQWYTKYSPAIHHDIENYFMGSPDESRLVPPEEEPIGEESPAPPPKKAVHSAGQGTQPAVYTNIPIYDRACTLATDLCKGLHTLPTEDTLTKWILFYYNILTKHAQGK